MPARFMNFFAYNHTTHKSVFATAWQAQRIVNLAVALLQYMPQLQACLCLSAIAPDQQSGPQCR